MAISTGIELNSDGVMFITDSENHRIIKWIPGKSSGTVIAGGNGNGNNMNQFNYPFAALVGSDGNLYVADRNNHRVQKVDLNSKIVIKAGSKSSDIKFINQTLKDLHPSDVANLIENLSTETRAKLIEIEEFNIDPEIFIELNESIQSEVLQLLSIDSLIKIIKRLESDNAIKILENLSKEVKEKVLEKLPPKDKFLLKLNE